MSAPISPTLDEATSKQLVEELFNRFDSAVFLAVRDIGDSRAALQVGHKGSPEYAIGLLRSYTLKLERSVMLGWDEAADDADPETDWMDGE